MALSKKDQVNIKLQFAADVLMNQIKRADAQLQGKAADAIRDDPELWRIKVERDQLLIQYENIMRLFESLKKKQKTRLILAVCSGELADGTPCEYKIRASMMCYMRGVPNCPDPLCNKRGRAMEVQIKDEEIEAEMDAMEAAQTPAEKMAFDMSEANRRDAQEKVRANKAGLKRFHGSKAQAQPKQKNAAEIKADFSNDDSAKLFGGNND